ncbi:MAG: DUF1553 domain-containing protein [Planctomycetota bacterium]|nr:DUF1553 domain-containing protein [Planctomycetota bacterium]
MFRLRPVSVFLVTYALSCAVGTNIAAQDYEKDIKPILRARCYACHGSLKQESDLRLDTGADLRQGTEQGQLLIERITSEDEDFRMPPMGEALSKAEIEMFRLWVQRGASSPPTEAPESDPRDHWSFTPPTRPHIPKRFRGNPIDFFIERRHRQHRLTAASVAPADVRLRRLYLDLIGVPPTPEELTDFLTDHDPASAWTDAADRLLNDPRYGQRWARHWMDVWRYSDWYGRRNQNDVRNSSAQIWMWRDWIVQSLNENMGYHTMVQQMLAADEMSPLDDAHWPATGYLVRNYYSLNPNEWMRHNVEYTGKAFLGLTFNCAHCHDHKYDPIRHEDYFRMRAFFEPMSIRQDQVTGESRPLPFVEYKYAGSRAPALVGMSRVFDKNEDAITYFYHGGDERNREPDHTPILAGVPAFLQELLPPVNSIELPTQAWYPGSRESIRQYELNQAHQQVAQAEDHLRQLPAIDPSILTPLEDNLVQTRQALERAIQTEKQDGASGALDGRYSLLLDAVQGRRVVSNTLPDLKNLTDGTTIEFQLRILVDGMANFQLIRDLKGSLTAGYVGFENGEIYSYVPGGFSRVLTGKYDFSGGESAFHVRLTIHPESDTADLQITILNPSQETDRILESQSIAINGWNPIDTDNKPILLDCRTGTRVLFDAIRVQQPGENPILLGFEGDKYAHGQDIDGIDHWRISTSSVSPAVSHVVEILDSDEIISLRRALQDAESRITETTIASRAATASLQAARQSLKSLKSVIAADQARYAEPSDPSAPKYIAQAVEQQRIAKQYQAQASLLQGKLQMATAMQLAESDSQRQPMLDAAKKSIEMANQELADTKHASVSPPADYEPLSVKTSPTSTGRRTALAQMITHRRNPLTARVAVNHIWMRHFHVPLVQTVFDFGRNGKTPTHPDLLDWLAVDFMEAGWDMKHLHALIVTSNAYQRRTGTIDKSLALDQDNRWLWRMNQGRMEAEVVRDTLLWVAGELDLTAGGRSLPNNTALSTKRRTLYYESYPEDGGTNPLGVLFDAPNPLECYRRTSTILPQQALALNNSDFVHHIASSVVERLEKDAPEMTDLNFISFAFQLVLSKMPSEQELSVCRDYLNHTDSEDAVPDSRIRRQGLIRVLINHNDFVSIR